MYSETKVVVRYAETDKMGIVHHSVYAIWYELARTELIKTSGITYSEMEKRGFMTPLVELNCRFIAPADYEDELTIRTRVEKLTPVRIVFSYEVYKGEKLLNTGSTMHAITNKELRPINLKKEDLEMYNFLSSMMEGEKK